MKVKKILKNFKLQIGKTWSYLSVYNSVHKRHKAIYNYYKKDNYDLKCLTADEKREYVNYWKSLSSNISLRTIEISKFLSNSFDKRIVPDEFYALYIEPTLNSDTSIKYLENKSLYNKWFGKGIFPKDHFHKIDNSYYNSKLELIDDITAFIDKNINHTDFPLVVKPNKDSYGGADIYFVNNTTEMTDILGKYPNLVVQEKIEQSVLLNSFNPASINTVRVCLYRDLKGNLHVVNASLRMGKDGSLDNETAGGIVCNINTSGILNEYAVDKLANKYFSHPNSKFKFKNTSLPMYDQLIEKSIEVGGKVVGAKVISLDMALDSSDEWRCIEINLFGQTIRFAQYAGVPFFGIYTDEVKNIVLTNKGVES